MPRNLQNIQEAFIRHDWRFEQCCRDVISLVNEMKYRGLADDTESTGAHWEEEDNEKTYWEDTQLGTT